MVRGSRGTWAREQALHGFFRIRGYRRPASDRSPARIPRPWIWIAGAIVLTLFLPNLIWQIRHHFPTIEDLANVRREDKNVVLGPLAFIKEQIIDMHPILLPVWLSGLVWFLRDRRWRVLGLILSSSSR